MNQPAAADLIASAASAAAASACSTSAFGGTFDLVIPWWTGAHQSEVKTASPTVVPSSSHDALPAASFAAIKQQRQAAAGRSQQQQRSRVGSNDGDRSGGRGGRLAQNATREQQRMRIENQREIMYLLR